MMTLTSFLRGIGGGAALLLVACSNPPARPSQNQGQNSTAPAPAPVLPRVIPAEPRPEAPARPRPCIDIRPVLMRCRPDERLTHEGCSGPAYMQHCAPDGS